MSQVVIGLARRFPPPATEAVRADKALALALLGKYGGGHGRERNRHDPSANATVRPQRGYQGRDLTVEAAKLEREVAAAPEAGVRAFTAALSVLGRWDQLALMQRVEAHMARRGVPHDVWSLTALLSAHAARGDVLNADRVFARCKALARPMEASPQRDYRNEATLSAYITAFVENRDTEGALQVFRNEVAPPHGNCNFHVPLSVVNTTLRAFPRYRPAKVFLDHQCETLKLSPDGTSYANLLWVCGEGGDARGADEVLAKCKDEGFELTGASVVCAMRAYTRAGRCDGALALFRSMRGERAPSVVRALLEACEAAGDPALVAPAAEAYAAAVEPLGRPPLPLAAAAIRLFRTYDGWESEAEAVQATVAKTYRRLPREFDRECRPCKPHKSQAPSGVASA